MQYKGSKRRIAKHILPIILAGRKPGQTYVEPFMGGCNSLEHVQNPRLAADIHPELVALFQALIDGWVPPDVVTVDEHRTAKMDPSAFLPHIRGFIGFCCSFGADWMHGYARHAYDSATRSACLENKRSLLKQVSKLKGTTFECAPYWELDIPDCSLIYCDPPYAGTSKYKDCFDSDMFWEWCSGMSSIGHSVFVSEYTAPVPWQEIWRLNVVLPGISPKFVSKGVERLFTI